MPADRLFAIEYCYARADEPLLAPFARELAREFGGQHSTRRARTSVLDLTSSLDVVLTVSTSAMQVPALVRHFAGRFDPQSLRAEGPEVQARIARWLEELNLEMETLLQPLIRRVRQDCPRLTSGGLVRALPLLLRVGTLEFNLILNHQTVDDCLLEAIPIALSNGVRYVLDAGIPEDASVTQFYYDLRRGGWRYLFMPTTAGFGTWMDRYVDLTEGTVRSISSRREFLDIFKPDEDDSLKFLVNPFSDTHGEAR